jgi:hypothetical protein
VKKSFWNQRVGFEKVVNFKLAILVVGALVAAGWYSLVLFGVVLAGVVVALFLKLTTREGEL